MPRWYKRDPERIRRAVIEHQLSERAAATLSALIDFVGPEQTMPGEPICHGGLPITAELLVVATFMPLKPQRLALMELKKSGYVEPGEHSRIRATEKLLNLIPPPDSSTERQKRYRDKHRDVPSFDLGDRHGDVAGDGERYVTRDADVTPVDREREERERYPGTTLRSVPGLGMPEEWANRVRSEVDALAERDLASLTVSERYLVARRHALDFANCTRSELNNRAKSRSIAAGIAALTDRLNRERSDVTVGEYLIAARSLWERGGEVPMYRPLDVLAELAEAPR